MDLCLPHINMLKSLPPAPQSMTLFADRVFAEAMNLE